MLTNVLNVIRTKSKALSIKTLTRLVIGMCLLFAIGLGAMWYLTGKRNTPEYAIAEINAAILGGQGEQLARYVDFRTLGQRFVDSILKYESRQTDEHSHRTLQETIQVAILEAFQTSRLTPAGEGAGGGHGGGEAATPAPAAASAQGTSRVLPPDIMDQLRRKPFVLNWSDATLAIASAPFHHERLRYDGILKLSLQQGDANWMVTEIANADELIQTYFAAEKRDKEQKINAFRAENLRRTETMNSHYYVNTCKAFVAKNVDERADVPLVVSVEGVNMGMQPLLSAGMVCTLTDAAGNALADVPLNSVRRIDAGKPFQQSWQFELPRSHPQTKLLLREKTLACRTRVSAVSLGDGKIVFLRPEKDLQEILQ